jgi:chromosome segregation protein
MDDGSLKDLPAGVIAFTAQGLCIAGEDDFLVSGRGGTSVLSRKAEQENLGKIMKQTEGDLARAQSHIDELEVRMNEDRAIVIEIDGRLQQQNAAVLAIMAELQSAQQVATHKQELLAAQEQTMADLERQDSQFRDELTKLEASRSSLEVELRNAEAELVSIREEAAGLEERREEVFRQNQNRSVDLAKSESRATALRESFTHARAQQELLQNKLSRRYEEQSAIQNDIESAKNLLEHSQSRIEGLIDRRAELDEKVAEKREAQAGIHEELRVIDSRLKECREHQAKVQKSLSDKNVQIERATMAITSVNGQAQEKYQLDIATYTFTYDPEFEADKAARSVGTLRGRIESLGPINMMALREFEDLTTRETFIRAQQDEINASIALLNEAINEIEVSSKDKFLAVFTVINREFGQLFPILFPNGEGHLELTNPEDPLNGGVEIMVRLPGKKPQNMNLFSGGEKALTAISLIFALLKTKPTPFCFLDEVDAPLDEANVGRYNRVLDALSDQFQFIIITHNRRTMEVLDTLYGVTMQEPGVSSIVGVDMKKDLPNHLRKAFKDEPKKTTSAAAIDDGFDPEGPVPVLPVGDGRTLEGASSR